MNNLTALPVDAYLLEIQQELLASRNVVIQAAPGTGKTTRIPPYLAKVQNGKVLVLEPRRIAAKLSALRVCEEQGWQIGREAGYKFRSENKTSAQTKLIYLTEGLLVRQMISDPELKGVAVVVLDEFHERHLHGDVALALIRNLQKTKRPDLRIVVMSATLEVDQLPDYLEPSRLFSIEGKRFPVDEIYLENTPSRFIEDEVLKCVRSLNSTAGDVLVFLPGKREIQNCFDRLQQERFESTEILPLYGELSVSEQQRAMTPVAGKRRIILSTNIAETSVTIEGVRVVVDSGLHRRSSFSPWSGVPKLELKPISKASCIQRAGRAGRLSAGKCYRLYTKADYQSRLEFEQPEVQRSDLLSTALELYALGGELDKLIWFENPRQANWDASVQTLKRLNLVKENSLTELGQRVVQLPLPPRLGLALELASQQGFGLAFAPLLLNLSEGESDHVDPVHPLEQNLSPKAERAFKILSHQIKGSQTPTPQQVQQILLTAFADKLARYRKKTNEKVDFTMAFGGSVETGVNSQLVRNNPEYILVLEAYQSGKDSAKIVAGIPVDKSIVENHPLVQTREQLSWNEQKKRVQKKSGLYFGEIVIYEAEESLTEAEKEIAAKILLQEGLGVGPESYQNDSLFLERLKSKIDVEPLRYSLARIRCAIQHNLFEKKIDFSNWLKVGIEGCLSVEDIQDVQWIEKWLSVMSVEQFSENMRLIESHCPTSIKLGTRTVKVQYELEQNPWIESRIQDFFGLRTGPHILKGRLPLTVHLLAPNQRAVQVTQDLEGFWKNHYPKMRIELGRRYPKHKWPDDPLNPTSSLAIKK